MRIHSSVIFAATVAALALTSLVSIGQANDDGQASAAQGDATTVQKTASISAADFSEPRVWAAAKNVVAVKHLYLSDQPDQATLDTAVENGVGVVINLRGPDELDWDEDNAVTKLGMTYYSVPIARHASSFDADTLAQISALVGKHRDTKILVYCASGNRVSGWFAVHLARDHGMSLEESIDLSKNVGLTKGSMKSRVRKFMATESGE